MSTRTIRRAGERVSVTWDDDATLLEVARGALGVRSALHGCDDATCGSCRVLLDGALVKGCRVRWGDVPEGATFEAYEDLAEDPAAARAVAAFELERPTRCKLCVGALGVAAVSLARGGRAGRAAAVEDVLDGATCMCTGRGSLRRALMAK